MEVYSISHILFNRYSVKVCLWVKTPGIDVYSKCDQIYLTRVLCASEMKISRIS